MTENRRQILDMLAQGKINVDEAERLMALIDQPSGGGSSGSEAADKGKSRPRYLRVVVEPGPDGNGEEQGERVNIRIPMALIRAGVKLAALIPTGAINKVNEKLQQKGINTDLGNLKFDGVEQLIDAIADMQMDIQDGKERVRIFVE